MTRTVAVMIFTALSAVTSASFADTRAGNGGDGSSPSGFSVLGRAVPTWTPDVANDANTDGQFDHIVIIRTGL